MDNDISKSMPPKLFEGQWSVASYVWGDRAFSFSVVGLETEAEAMAAARKARATLAYKVVVYDPQERLVKAWGRSGKTWKREWPRPVRRVKEVGSE